MCQTRSVWAAQRQEGGAGFPEWAWLVLCNTSEGLYLVGKFILGAQWPVAH